jgi:hypothetical protein
MVKSRLVWLMLAAWAALAANVSVAAGQGPRVGDGGIRVTERPQQRLRVAPGQYSGITHVAGDRYAVVDDKLPGGGIVFFELPLRKDGSVRAARVRRTVPEATLTASEKGLDNEGVAFAGGRLYVSAESDQSIREYDLGGRPTGRAFPVPADMGVSAITGNAGFEALTHCAQTGSFWTTTELPLKADGRASRLHRLQRFDAGFQAAERYLYQTDGPSRSQAETSSAMAYVFGISALTALDDGRLIVLEREVFVPSGTPGSILQTAFSRVKLYVVRPAGDGRDILPKQLLCEFETRISLRATGVGVALANYEGMCLGPRLPDGRRCLILLADSQAGMGDLAARLGRKVITNEFVKVLLLEGEDI